MRYTALAIVLFAAACGSPDHSAERAGPRAVVSGGAASAETIAPFAAPRTPLSTVDGKSVSLSTFRGTTVVVNFWATWCGPCLHEIPDLADIHRDWSDRGATVIGVAYSDPDTTAVRTMVKQLAMPYPVAIDGRGDWAEAFGGVFVMPSTFLVDPTGMVVERFTGLADPDSVRAEIARLSRDQT